MIYDNLTPCFGDWLSPTWQRCFAWLPTHTYDGGTVWLRPVYRRRVLKHYYLSGGADSWWVYRRYAPQ